MSLVNRADRPLGQIYVEALLGTEEKKDALPTKIALNEASEYGIVHLAEEVYQTRDEKRPDYGSIWYLQITADGKKVLVKDLSPEGETLRKVAYYFDEGNPHKRRNLEEIGRIMDNLGKLSNVPNYDRTDVNAGPERRQMYAEMFPENPIDYDSDVPDGVQAFRMGANIEHMMDQLKKSGFGDLPIPLEGDLSVRLRDLNDRHFLNLSSEGWNSLYSFLRDFLIKNAARSEMTRLANPMGGMSGGAPSGFGMGNSPIVAPYGGATPQTPQEKLEWITNNEQTGRDPREDAMMQEMMMQQMMGGGNEDAWKEGFADGFSEAFFRAQEQKGPSPEEEMMLMQMMQQQGPTPLDQGDMDPSVQGEPKAWSDVTRMDTQF